MRMNVRVLLIASLGLLSGCSQNPWTWWKSLNEKAHHLATVETKYEALLAEHERLEKEYFRLEHDYTSLSAQVNSQQLAHANLEATGSPTGRNPASIAYAPPKGLDNQELLSLAYEHLREKRFPEAAITFEEYLSKPETAGQDGDALYSAGVAWFQTGNFRKARENFESAKEHANGENKQKITRKVDLWLRVMDRKTSAEVKVPEHAHGG